MKPAYLIIYPTGFVWVSVESVPEIFEDYKAWKRYNSVLEAAAIYGSEYEFNIMTYKDWENFFEKRKK